MGISNSGGSGYGSGYGFGYGYGSGGGDGYGDGYGYGYGGGDGDGYGYGYGEMDLGDSSLLAWHFVQPSGHLQHDISNVVVHVGLELSIEDDPVLCKRGYHASFSVEDARGYCDGILCRVEVGGKVIVEKDKLVAQRRKVLAMYPDGKKPALEAM